MSHIPVNHHLRPLYRVAAVVTAGCLVGFGALSLDRTRGADWFARGEWTVAGLPTNRAFAAACLGAGAVVLVAALVGRNVDLVVNLCVGGAFLLAGTAMMALAHTAANVLNFSVGTSVAAYAVGLVLLAAGLYGKVGRGETPRRAGGDPAAAAPGFGRSA